MRQIAVAENSMAGDGIDAETVTVETFQRRRPRSGQRIVERRLSIVIHIATNETRPHAPAIVRWLTRPIVTTVYRRSQFRGWRSRSKR